MLRYLLATAVALAIAGAAAYGSLTALSRECASDVVRPSPVLGQRNPAAGDVNRSRPESRAGSPAASPETSGERKPTPAEWWHRFVCGIHAGEFVVAASAVFIGLLALLLLGAIHQLWLALRDTARAQKRDSEIVQRAYLSVYPLGINPFDASSYAEGHIGIRNVGHLPAQKVRWFIAVTPSSDNRRAHFPIGAFSGSNVVHATSEMRQWGRAPISPQEFQNFLQNNLWIYVWGVIHYDDGFGNERHTNFCHRYDARGFSPSASGLSFEQALQLGRATISPEGAVYHQHGNEAD